jgi:hypothetical protein
MVQAGSRDKVIHNYLFQLYVLSGDENQKKLMDFIGLQFDCPLFDVQYALRLCKHHHLVQPLVQLYSILNMEDEAITVALESNDLELSQTIAQRLDDDDDRKKKIWEKIVKHCIEKNKDYKLAMKISKQGLIKIESVLEIFPDFVKIDDIKNDLVDALEEYDVELSKLSNDLDESCDNSGLIRKDIKALQKR